MKKYTHAWYIPGSTSIVDLAEPDGTTAILKKTAQQVKEQEPKAFLYSWVDVQRLLDEAIGEKYIKAPAEIDEAHWIEMLEVLPPGRHETSKGAESFYLIEGLACGIYRFYVRLGDRYFELNRPLTYTHDQLIQDCRDVAK